MFWRRKQQAEGGIPPHLRDGWTEELLRSAIDSRGSTRDEQRNEHRHVDHQIYLSGYGQAVNKFETQRMFWGWVGLRFGRVPVPAHVRVRLHEHVYEAAYNDCELDTPQSAQGKDAGVVKRQDLYGDHDAEHRHKVGHVLLDCRSCEFNDSHLGGRKGLVPVFEIGLSLTHDEWAPVRECLELSQWRTGRGPSLSVRVELPQVLAWAELLEAPWSRSFPITRFWIESVVAFHKALDQHPLFKVAIESGGIEELFG